MKQTTIKNEVSFNCYLKQEEIDFLAKRDVLIKEENLPKLYC